MHRLAPAAAALAALAALLLAPAALAGPKEDADAARAGLAEAVAAARVSAEAAPRYDAALTAVLDARMKLPPLRVQALDAVLADVARQAKSYDEARALALFSMLEFNVRQLSASPVPREGTDVVDADGVLYRWFNRRGFQFHPLGNFGRLNALTVARRGEEATQLASSLVARGVRSGDALLWEYYFPYGGPTPWTSGMAQAVAAQALARSAALTGMPPLAEAAVRAALGARTLIVQDARVGAWTRLYSFSGMLVLNAQLQAAISIAEYAQLIGDEPSRALAAELQAVTAAALPLFDTGHWSLYALGGREATLHYHRLVVQQLRRLAVVVGPDPWRAYADRFDAYTRQPPVLSVVRATTTLKGKAVRAQVRLRVSKRSTVTFEIGGHRHVRTLDGGLHTVAWVLPRRPAPRYAFRLTAVDQVGNRVRHDLPALQLRR